MEIGQAESSITTLISSLDKVNNSLNTILNNNGLSSLTKGLNGAKVAVNEVNPLFKQLNELQRELNKSGDTDIAKQVKEFSKELYKTEYSKADTKIKEIRALIEKELGNDFVEDFNKSLEKTNNFSIGNLFKKLSGTSVKSALTFGTIITLGKKAYQTYKEVGGAYIDLIESNNLFEVQLGKVTDEYGNLDEKASEYYIKAMKFQNQMNEAFATNKSEMKEYQAMYYSMFESQGINKDTSYFLSEQLTKAGYDMASLFNMETTEAMEKLRAGIAGQTEPLRAKGIDVSESSLQKVLTDVGIDRSVQELSYAEKEIARYISIVRQAGEAQGDFARTIDSPSNQLKMLTNQFAELKQVAGSFIVNAFGGIIVWANAIIMAIKEILKAIGNLFGFEMETTNSVNLAENVGVDDLNSGLGTATKKAKEFKKQILGFDEINNITPQTDSGSSSGSGGGLTGVDSKLLSAIDEWDNKMGDITGKAQEYRDKILEAYGFTRDSNGELKWSWDNCNKIVVAITGLLAMLGTIKLIKKVGEFASGVKGIFDHFSKGKAKVDEVATSTGKLSTNLGKALTFTAGLAGVAISDYFAYDSMKDFAEGTAEAEESVFKLIGTVGSATASGALAGSAIDPGIGTAIGGLIGLASAGISAWAGYNKGLEETQQKLEETRSILLESTDQYIAFKDNLNTTLKGDLSETTNIKKLREELDRLVDSNGQIKTGYEERVKYITNELKEAYGIECDIVGDTIKQYEKYKESIDNAIDNKNFEITMKGLEEEFKYAQENMDEAFKKYQMAEDGVKRIEAMINHGIDSGMKKSFVYRLYGEAYEEAKKVRDETYETYQEMLNDQQDYYRASIAQQTGNTEEMKEIAKEYLVGVEDMTEVSLQTNVNMYKTNMDELLKISEQKGGKLTEGEKSMYSESASNLAYALKQQNLQIINMTPETVEAWKTLAKADMNAYNDTLKQLPESTRLLIETTTGTVDAKSPETAKKWKQLADKSRLEYYTALLKLPKETRDIIKSSVKEISSQNTSASNAGKTLGQKIKSAFESVTKNTGNSAKNFIQGFINIIKQKNPLDILTYVGNLGTNILKKFNGLLGIHSPSRETMDSAKYFVLGFTNQIDKSSNGLLAQVGQLASNITDEFNNNIGLNGSLKGIGQGILVDTKAIQVDTKQSVDYSQIISGGIKADANVAVGQNLIQGIIDAVRQGINEADVNVQVEAKTEEGVIVKKASQGFRDYVTKTGELPFPVPVGGI